MNNAGCGGRADFLRFGGVLEQDREGKKNKDEGGRCEEGGEIS